ncbi:unnamed protein product [Symbiodinium sp. CCMP2592]|nr:unnamed protein product [Symbiodinium sp. CCMP2592]
MKILNQMHLMPPVKEDVGLPESRRDLRNGIAFLFRCTQKLQSCFKYAESSFEIRDTEGGSIETKFSLMFLLGSLRVDLAQSFVCVLVHTAGVHPTRHQVEESNISKWRIHAAVRVEMTRE